MTGTYTPWGLKKQNNYQNTPPPSLRSKKKIDHTKRQLLTHMAPPEPPEPHAEFLCGSEGLIGPPLPHLHTEEVPAIEHLLYGWHHPYRSTAKERQI